MSRITGGRDNFLGIEFSDVEVESPPMIDLRNPKRGSYVEPADILANVRIGLAEASQETGKPWYAGRVYYYSDDAPPATIYRDLAIELVLRVFGGEPFDS